MDNKYLVKIINKKTIEVEGKEINFNPKKQLTLREIVISGFKETNQRLTRIEQDVNVLKKDVNVFKKDVNVLKKDVVILKSDIKEIKNTPTMKKELSFA